MKQILILVILFIFQSLTVILKYCHQGALFAEIRAYALVAVGSLLDEFRKTLVIE
jgi:hypothetical protein